MLPQAYFYRGGENIRFRSIRLSIAVFLILQTVLLASCSGSLNWLTGRSVRKNVYLGQMNVGGMKEEELKEFLENTAGKTDVNAENARIDPVTWEVHPEKSGKKLNIEKTFASVMEAEEGEKVSPAVDEIEPTVTSAQLQANIVEIGSYSTPLLNRSDSRINNIDLAAEEIDYKILSPGEEFSFNSEVGKRTQSKGYEKAPIIVRTEDGPEKGYGVGGGVCQLSSTIYNAVEESGLKITERHEHSKNVGYVPKGEDATVSYGAVDFKFRNNRDYPIMLRVHLSSKRVTVRVLENRNAQQ